MPTTLTKSSTFMGVPASADFFKQENTVLMQKAEGTLMNWMKKIRGSPAYFKESLNKSLAIVRAYGPPTWFVTFTTAELTWPNILSTIYLISGGKIQPGENVQALQGRLLKLPNSERHKIINQNIAVCAAMFDRRLQAIFRTSRGPAKPLGEITRKMYRIEFQQRGTLHAHCVFWTKESIFEADSDTKKSFVDKYVTTNPEEIPQHDQNLVDFQNHSCTNTCL